MKTNKGHQWFENKVVMMVIATFGFEIHLDILEGKKGGWGGWCALGLAPFGTITILILVFKVNRFSLH
jgi:hypothetical protein